MNIFDRRLPFGFVDEAEFPLISIRRDTERVVIVPVAARGSAGLYVRRRSGGSPLTGPGVQATGCGTVAGILSKMRYRDCSSTRMVIGDDDEGSRWRSARGGNQNQASTSGNSFTTQVR